MRSFARAASGVVLLAALPYLNSLSADFAFDDVLVIRDNPVVTGPGASCRRLCTWVPPTAWYRPLTMLTYFANARIDPRPVGFHAVNVALHVLVSLAVLGFALQITRSSPAAIVTAALFAVHPIHTEAVTGIVGRAELLAALCVLTSLLALMKAMARSGGRHIAWQAASLAAFVAGLFAKESAFTAIGLAAVVIYWLSRDRRARTQLSLLAPFVVLGGVCLALRTALVGSIALPSTPPLLDNPLASAPLPSRLATATVILWQYIAALMLPIRLSADYSFNQIPVVRSIDDPRLVGAVIVVVSLAAGAVFMRKRAPVLVLAAAFTVIPLALTSNILFPIGTIKAERLLYLPSVGWCLAAGWLAGERFRSRRAVRVLIVVCVAAYAGRTWARNWDWHDDTTLFKKTVYTSPRSAKARFNVAVAYRKRGEFALAISEYRQVLKLLPSYERAAFDIGTIYEKMGNFDRALEWYRKALDLDWSAVAAHLNMARLRYQFGEYLAAEAAARSGLQAEPDNPKLLETLAVVRNAEGYQWDAGTLLDRAAAVAGEDEALLALIENNKKKLRGSALQ